MKAAHNGAAAFGEVEKFDDREGAAGSGKGRKKNTGDEDEANASDRGDEDEDEESSRKSRLGLNKRSGDDDEEGPRGGDLDFDDDDIEKGENCSVFLSGHDFITGLSICIWWFVWVGVCELAMKYDSIHGYLSCCQLAIICDVILRTFLSPWFYLIHASFLLYILQDHASRGVRMVGLIENCAEQIKSNTKSLEK